MADIWPGSAEQQVQLWQQVIETSHHGILITDAQQPDNPIIYVSPAFEGITGYSQQEAVGRSCRFLLGDESHQSPLSELYAAFQQQRECRVLLRTCRKDGSLFWNDLTLQPVRDSAHMVTHFVGIMSDVTEYKDQVALLLHQAGYDPLTQLPNRKLLEDHFKHAIARCRRAGQKIAALLLDLDNFKKVNDTLGHELGDAVLQAVAGRLLSCLRASDTVGHLGGDEFVILVEGWQRNDQIVKVAHKIQASLTPSLLKLEEHEIFVTASIGASLFPKDGADAQALLKNAEIAMYKAKMQGRNAFRFYASEMNARAIERLTLENDLRRALERDELELYYQPQLELTHQQILGVEALLRWRHPKLGMVSPAEFVPLAEETGLIVPIGEWVLRTACAQARTWQQQGLPPLRMAVNLSVAQFVQPSFAKLISRMLSETGLAPSWLELEITESLLMRDVGSAVTILSALKEMGVHLAIDDFGTGYSSLNYLKRFPIDRLKIDRSFVQDISSDPDDAAIALAVIVMAHSMNLRVLAEGVETDAQLAFLKARACDEMQGFYFSRPLPAADAKRWLEEHRRWEMQPEQESGASAVLLADSDSGLLASCRAMLAQDGYQVLLAGDARTGLDLLARHPVGVVIADLRLPEIGGIEFLKRVRKLYPGALRIALSDGREVPCLLTVVNECAIFKLLTKPLALTALRDAVREAFASPLVAAGVDHALGHRT